MMSPNRWKTISPSQVAWESEALQFLREVLPDQDPYRAWSNFEFHADDGTINEVDVLVLTPMGFFLVEIKSRPGELAGDAYTWTWRHDGRVHTDDSPLLLANRKARKLASLLKRQKSFRKGPACPHLEAVVFCSAAGLRCRLPEEARRSVFLRDGILAALVNRTGVASDRAPQHRHGDATARALLQAMQDVGIKETLRSRRGGDYQLERLFSDSPTGLFQDWIARHVSLPKTSRVVRIYPAAAHSTSEERATLQRYCQREFNVLQDLLHPGIALAESFTIHELGPAIVFRWPPEAQRLDHFLAERGDRVQVTTRIEWLRQLTEALKYAHERKVIHRALSPQSVLVLNPDAEVPRLQIFNWQLHRRSGSTTTHGGSRITATLHAEQLVEDASAVYLAPEAQQGLDEDHPAQDIFSLGALAYYLFTGKPPGATPIEVSQRVATEDGLDLARVVDAPGDALRSLIRSSTHPDRLMRPESAADLLHRLTEVEDELTTPDAEARQNPLEARKGDRLPGGFEVVERLGQGSTAVALLVSFQGQEFVLKIANKPEHNDRLKAEFAALQKLEHPGIVHVHREVTLHHLQGFLMERAGHQTLAKRIRDDGRLNVDFLERFGTDLIEAVGALEAAGVAHRDIKPENIGIRERGKQSELHLILFDFSLTSTSVENVRCGTPQYLDPFLIARKPPRWDLAAERYAVAMTLYEMATGDFPQWGDGGSSPALLACEANLFPERFEPALREPLVAFFERAFRRDPKQRFDNAAQMLAQWRAIFAAADRSVRGESTADPAARLALIEGAALNTQLVELALSTRAANALDKLNAVTVRDLLRISLWRLNRLRGVGKQTIREIGDLHVALRKRFPEIQPLADPQTEGAGEGLAAEPEVPNLDFVAQQVRATGGRSRGESDRLMLHSLLGFPTEGVPVPLTWPSQTEVARALKVSRQRVGQAVAGGRERWRRFKSITELREVVVEFLGANGGAMTVREIADALLAARGSVQIEPERGRTALAVARAVIETELGMQEPRFVECRSDGRVLIATSHALGDYGFRLGSEADAMALLDPLAPPARVVEGLRRLPVPAGAAPMSDARIVKLSVGASRRSALSSRLEIYPRGLDPARAVQLAAGALLGTHDLSDEEVRQRVASRYPEAAPLPPRPELDRLLEGAGTKLKWDSSVREGKGGFRQERADRITLSTGTPSRTSPTPTSTRPPAPAEDEVLLGARDFQARLRRSMEQRGYLVLVTEPADYLGVEERLRTVFQPSVVDLDASMIERLKAACAARSVRWEKVLSADGAEAGSRDWRNLQLLVEQALGEVEQEVLGRDGCVLMTNVGLLARYGRLNFLSQLQNAVLLASSGSRTLWVLVPSNRQTLLP
ncbi:MAG: BREX system serine/threonine kinase PglW, partial [Limisphaerales bacterium]